MCDTDKQFRCKWVNSDDEHIELIKKCVQVILSWDLDVKVVGVWVDGSWNVIPV